MKKIISLAIFCFISLIATAQSEDDYYNFEDRLTDFDVDSTRRTDVKHLRTTWKWLHDGVYKKIIPIDTTLDGIHNNNYIFKESVSNSYLGNFPSPYESNIFIRRAKDMDFYPLNVVRAYLFRPEDALEFAATTPFTQVKYNNGGGSGRTEDLLDLWHVQNITPVWSAGFRYNLISSEGQYLYQKSKAYNFSIFSAYEKERMALSFFLNQNVGHFTENGGVENLDHIRDTTMDSKIVGTWISQEPRNNYYNFNLHLLGQYNIGNPRALVTEIDSVRADTSYSYPIKVTFGVTVEENQHKFKERTSVTDYFDFTFLDSTSNASILDNKKYEIASKLILNEHPRLKYLPGAYAGLTYKYENYQQKNAISVDTVRYYNDKYEYYGTYLTAGIFNVDTSAIFQYDVWGNFCLFGDWVADYKLGGEITQYLNRDRNSFVKVKANFENKSANYFLNHYWGNHDFWNENFNKVTRYDIEGAYHNNKYRAQLGLGISNTNGYIYFEESWPYQGDTNKIVAPTQFNGNLFVLTAWAHKVFKAGHFFFDQKVYFQQSSKENVLVLPKLAVYSHNYYRNKFFNDVLDFQIGLDVFYNTSFYADAYRPSLMQFYKQRIEKTGNYPKMDVFLAIHLKRADIYVKYEHLSQYFAGRDYFTAYTYPINPARFKFGVRWNFYD